MKFLTPQHRAAVEKSTKILVAKYCEMAEDEHREREAAEWIEGLISDPSTQR
jgi:hypothetical protein